MVALLAKAPQDVAELRRQGFLIEKVLATARSVRGNCRGELNPLDDCHLSKVVLADFAQLTPNRFLSVTTSRDSLATGGSR
ncbi:MAG: hypothetical protein ACRD0U_02370 [Acidimicrobiales bacterium]